MEKMKKILCIIIAFSMICFAACNFSNNDESSNGSLAENSSLSDTTNSLGSVEDSSEGTSGSDNSSGEIEDSSDAGNEDSSVEKQMFTITFKQAGVGDIVKTVEEGQTLTDVPIPNPVTGYNVAWSVADFSNVAENMTVEVVKTAKTYTITYTLGSCANDALAQIASEEQLVTYDAAYELETPTCEGYLFAGWMIEGSTTVLEDGNWAIDDDVTLVAQWTVDPSSNRDHTGRY
jgi:hypothetical protein